MSKFVGGSENLYKFLKYNRNPHDKSNHGYKGKKYVHDDSINVCYLCGKPRHVMSKCRHLPRRVAFNTSYSNKKTTQVHLGTYGLNCSCCRCAWQQERNSNHGTWIVVAPNISLIVLKNIPSLRKMFKIFTYTLLNLPPTCFIYFNCMTLSL